MPARAAAAHSDLPAAEAGRWGPPGQVPEQAWARGRSDRLQPAPGMPGQAPEREQAQERRSDPPAQALRARVRWSTAAAARGQPSPCSAVARW